MLYDCCPCCKGWAKHSPHDDDHRFPCPTHPVKKAKK